MRLWFLQLGVGLSGYAHKRILDVAKQTAKTACSGETTSGQLCRYPA